MYKITKKCAVEMGNLLLKHFDYVECPNYLHKIFEHVQQLIEDPNGPGSVGVLIVGATRQASNCLDILEKSSRVVGTHMAVCVMF